MEAAPEGRAVAHVLLVAMGLANAAGHLLDLHARFWWFDRFLHACTILAATPWLALFVCRRVLLGGAGRGASLVAVIASVGLAIGALWKVAEWGFDRIAPGDVIKGKHDTVMDTFGALAAGVAILKFLRPAAAPPAAPGTP